MNIRNLPFLTEFSQIQFLGILETINDKNMIHSAIIFLGMKIATEAGHIQTNSNLHVLQTVSVCNNNTIYVIKKKKYLGKNKMCVKKKVVGKTTEIRCCWKKYINVKKCITKINLSLSLIYIYIYIYMQTCRAQY